MADASSDTGNAGPYTVPADVVARQVGDVTVVVRLGTNRIYELNPTGARIWEFVQQSMTRDQVIDQLAREFDADHATLAADFDGLVARLRAEGLL